MTNQELIAAARGYADLLADGAASTDGAFRYLRALADALESAHEAIDVVQGAHEKQLTRMAQERARLQRKVERLTSELEAAQRAPLGYIVVAKAPSLTEPDVADYANPSIGVYPTDALAREAARRADENTVGRAPAVYREGLQHIVAEVREAQP